MFKWTRPSQWTGRKHTHRRLVWGVHTFHIWYTPHRGWWCSHAETRHRGGVLEKTEYPTEWRTVKKIKIAATAPGSGPVHLAAVETNLFHKLPAVVAHCAVTRYDDGEVRKPGWVIIKTQGAMWVATAKDPDACAQIVATGQTLDDAIALLDLLLGAHDAPWEPDPYLKPARPGGRRN